MPDSIDGRETRIMKMRVIAALAFSVSLSACERFDKYVEERDAAAHQREVAVAVHEFALRVDEAKRQAQREAQTLPPAEAAPAPRMTTPDDWKRSVLASYQELVPTDEGDGITSFIASFRGPKGVVNAFGKRDAFRKVRFYTPTVSKTVAIVEDQYLYSYVALPDCGAPTYMLRAYYFSKQGWLFMNQVAVLADGEVVLDHAFSNTEVARSSESYGIEESSHFRASVKDLTALRRIASANALSVRLTGSKGYVTLNEHQLSELRSDINDGLLVYNALHAALPTPLPASCN